MLFRSMIGEGLSLREDVPAVATFRQSCHCWQQGNTSLHPPVGQECPMGCHPDGPDAKRLMEQVLERIRSWDGENLSARIAAYAKP